MNPVRKLVEWIKFRRYVREEVRKMREEGEAVTDRQLRKMQSGAPAPVSTNPEDEQEKG